jgi:phage gpG-like protein
MATIKVDIKLKNWKTLENVFSQKSISLLGKNMSYALGYSGALAVKTSQNLIRTLSFEPNKHLTIMIKHSATPLVDTGQLFQAITMDWRNNFELSVGVNRKTNWKGNEVNLARLLHEGGRIKITPAMRSMFYFLWAKAMGFSTVNGKIVFNDSGDPIRLSPRAEELWQRNKVWFPLPKNRNFIEIPKRPFLKYAFMNAEYKKDIKKVWKTALESWAKEAVKP